ncbi:MAG: hypothetical protein PHE02_11210 [Lachnospiraceae bacterium]|nr:hypothetical protein [Lachnospiraceae bacterium]
MRIYSEQQELTDVICNMCNKHLKVKDGMLLEECSNIEQHFGYFSKKDGMIEKFDLCEECYDAFVKQFQLPAEQEETKEYL